MKKHHKNQPTIGRDIWKLYVLLGVLLSIELFIAISLLSEVISARCKRTSIKQSTEEINSLCGYYTAHNIDGTIDTIHYQQVPFNPECVLRGYFDELTNWFYCVYFDTNIEICKHGCIELRVQCDYYSRYQNKLIDKSFIDGLYSIWVCQEPEKHFNPIDNVYRPEFDLIFTF